MSGSSGWRERVQRLKDNPSNDEEPLETFDQLVVTSRVSDMAGIKRWLAQLGNGRWIYRGQSKACWYLQPSLERVTRQSTEGRDAENGVSIEGNSIRHVTARACYESELLDSFKRRVCGRLPQPLPEESDVLGWLGLMQHHGAPTRLLDWTSSLDVALYFALEKCRKYCSCAVWAIDRAWLESTSRHLMSGDPCLPAVDGDKEPMRRYLDGILQRPQNPHAVVLAEPTANARMVAQQGLFLCSLNLEHLTYAMLGRMIWDSVALAEPPARKLVIDWTNSRALLEELHDRGIDHNHLFPDPDNLGDVLTVRLEKRVRADVRREMERLGFAVTFPQRDC